MKTINEVKKAVAAFTSEELDIYRLTDTAIAVALENFEYDYLGPCPDKAEKAEIAKIKAFGGLVEAMGYKVMYDKVGIIIESHGCVNTAGII